MKHPDHTRSTPTGLHRTTASLGISLSLAAGLLSSPAADRTWNGGGDQSSWTDPLNWGGTAPSANDQLIFGGNLGLYNYNGNTGGTIFSNLTFNASAGAFTLTGNGIRFPSGSAVLGVLTNLSPNAQTISLNLTNNGGNRVYNAASGPIICDSVISGNNIVKEGTNSFTTTGSSGNASVGAIVNNGILMLGKSSGNALGSPAVVNTNGILRIIGPGTDQIHFNQRINMNGGMFQQQNVGGLTTTTLEEIASLSGSNLNSIVENGLANSSTRLDIGGGNGHRGIYSGTIRDGAAGVFALRVYRANNYEQLNGTNTYSGITQVDNSQGAGAARLIVNGAHTGGGAYTVSGKTTDSAQVAYLCGSGVISASVININANGLLSPGGALSADLVDTATFVDSTAILTISNAVNLNAATSSLEVQLNGTTPGVSHDQVVLAGSGTLSNNNANLKLVLGYTPQSGDKFTIVQVPGVSPASNIGIFAGLNGVPTDLSQGATFIEPSSGQNFQISYRADGANFDAGAGNGNDIMLRVVSSPGTNLVWRGDASYAWDIRTTANWRNTNGVALTFTNGDNVTFNDTGSNAAPIDLTTDLSPGSIVVNATNDYVFATSTAGKLTGTVVLSKTNTGTLTMLTDNNNAGSTLVRAGTLRIGTNGTSGTLSGALDIRTNATVIFDRSDTSTFSGNITGGGRLLQNGTNGTLTLTADSAFSGPLIVNVGTLQFGTGAGVSGSVVGLVTNNATVNYSFNNSVTINNSLSGTGMVYFVNTSSGSKRFTMGAGTASLTNNTFSGWFNVGPLACLVTPDGSNGTNQLGVNSTIYVQDTGSVLLDRNGLYPSTFYLQGAGNGSGNAGVMTLELEQGTTISGNTILLGDATIGGFLGAARISGRILGTNGTETVTFANRRSGATTYNLQIGSPAGPNLWGATVLEPGDYVGQQIRVTAMAPRALSTNALTIGAHGIFQLNGFDHTVASLASSGTDGLFVPGVLNTSATNPATLTVGTDDGYTTFDGTFGDGGAAPLGLTKVGAGTLTLSGISGNTGPVTVSGGSIALSGDGSFTSAKQIAIASGAVLDVSLRSDGSLNLNNGQTLKGSGTLNGTLVTAAGSVVNPGSSVGTLTVANNITLGGTLWLELDRTLTPNSDRLETTSGTITGGGGLTTTNLGPALQVGDTFKPFATGVSGITANLLTNDWRNGRSYTWQNDLAGLGSIKVLTSSPLPLPTLGMSAAGTTLTFSWDGPFKLQAQTNSLSVGIGSNWGDYPGGATSPVSVTVNPTNPAVFFRLLLQ